MMLPIDSETISAVLFDAGGTLVHIDYEIVIEAARACGFEIDEHAIRIAEAGARIAIDRRGGRSRAALGTDSGRVKPYFRDMLPPAMIADHAADEIAAAVGDSHRAENIWRVPMPDAAETLRELNQRGIRTAVLSNADGRAEQTLQKAGLTEHLEFVIDSHFEGVEKPDPEIFRRALQRFELPAERVVYIGDIYSIDAVGARAGGLSPVIIDPTETYRGLDCPIIRGLRELLEPVNAGGN